MRRNPDLIRAILLGVERAPACEILKLPPLKGFDPDDVHAHVALLVEADLLRTPFPHRRRGRPWLVLRLSWAGYDFLDRVRDPHVWRSTKAGAAKLGSWSLDTLGALAKAAIIARAQAIGVPMG